MRKILAAIILGVALSGCAILGPAPDLALPSTMSEASREVAKLVNEAKVNLIAANNAIASQVKAGTMTVADAERFAKLADEYWLKVKDVEKILAGGDEVLAKNRAQLISQLILALQKEVAARLAAQPKG